MAVTWAVMLTATAVCVGGLKSVVVISPSGEVDDESPIITQDSDPFAEEAVADDVVLSEDPSDDDQSSNSSVQIHERSADDVVDDPEEAEQIMHDAFDYFDSLEEDELAEAGLSQKRNRSASLTQKSAYALQAQNMIVYSGTNDQRTYLSCSQAGHVDLWTQDDNSGRQKWVLEPNPTMEWYNIKIHSGTNSGELYLSAYQNSGVVELYHQDDASGRQRWTVHPVEGAVDVFNIKVLGGVDGGRQYLSAHQDGKDVDLWTSDDGSGRQRWHLTRGMDKMIRMDIHDNQATQEGLTPRVQSWIINNPAPTTLSQTHTLQETHVTSSSTTVSVGTQFSIGSTISSSVSAGVGPLSASGSVEVRVDFTLSMDVSRTMSHSHSVQQTSSKTVTIPPFTNVRVEIISYTYTTDIPYTMHFESGRTVNGRWEGVVSTREVSTTTNIPRDDCTDLQAGWHSGLGSRFTCTWYSHGDRCASFGGLNPGGSPQFTANLACCACGGGS